MSNQGFTQQLACFLKQKRGKETLVQFSRKLGISKSTLDRLEKGDQNVTLKMVEQIIDRLKCSLNDVFPEKTSQK